MTRRRRAIRWGRVTLWAFSCLVLTFLLAPVLIVLPIAFSSGLYMQFPPPGFSLQWFESFFTTGEWLASSLRSLEVGLLAALGATILGTMAAFGLVRGQPRARALVTGFILFPLIVPVIIMAIALYFLAVKMRLIGSNASLVLGHIVHTVPYVVVVVSGALVGFPVNLERAATNLGATPAQTFRLVTFPLLRTAILVGALFAFINSFDEVVIALYLSGRNPPTLPVKMFTAIQWDIDPTMAAASGVVMIISTLVLVVVAVLGGKRRAAPAEAGALDASLEPRPSQSLT